MKTPTEFATDMRLTFQNALTYGLAIQVGMVAFSKWVMGGDVNVSHGWERKCFTCTVFVQVGAANGQDSAS